MKKTFFIIFAVCGLNAVGFADYVIQERMEHNGTPPQDVTIKLKDGKARCDVGTAMTTIATGGEVTMLMHAQKIAMKMPANFSPRSATAAKTGKESPSGPHEMLKPTGRTEKINGFDTEEYVHENPTLKATTHFWIAKDFPDKTEIMKVLTAMQTPMTKQLMQSAGTVLPEDYPGLPIRTEVESNLMGKPSKTIVTIVSIKKEAVDDSVFVVPADYRQGGPIGRDME